MIKVVPALLRDYHTQGLRVAHERRTLARVRGITTEQAARHALLLLALAGFALAAFYAPQFWASVAFSALIGWLSLKR